MLKIKGTLSATETEILNENFNTLLNFSCLAGGAAGAATGVFKIVTLFSGAVFFFCPDLEAAHSAPYKIYPHVQNIADIRTDCPISHFKR